jgi:hypothetical protein
MEFGLLRTLVATANRIFAERRFQELMMPVGETQLASLGFWPAEALQQLRENWITTAEQVVAISATSNGISALAQQTRLSEPEVRRLIAQTAEFLPDDIRQNLMKPADTSQFGRGAIKPSDRIK